LRSAWLAACSAALAVTLAGCGGGSEQEPPPSRIDQATAETLAAESERIAELLDAGDECTAAHQADELKRSVDRAVAAGRVPSDLGTELAKTAEALVNEVNCPPPPPPPDEDEDEDDEGKKGKGKGKGKKGEPPPPPPPPPPSEPPPPPSEPPPPPPPDEEGED
jgi:hypothetical protein